jgi:hypothetical protein
MHTTAQRIARGPLPVAGLFGCRRWDRRIHEREPFHTGPGTAMGHRHRMSSIKVDRLLNEPSGDPGSDHLLQPPSAPGRETVSKGGRTHRRTAVDHHERVEALRRAQAASPQQRSGAFQKLFPKVKAEVAPPAQKCEARCVREPTHASRCTPPCPARREQWAPHAAGRRLRNEGCGRLCMQQQQQQQSVPPCRSRCDGCRTFGLR